MLGKMFCGGDGKRVKINLEKSTSKSLILQGENMVNRIGCWGQSKRGVKKRIR